MNFEKSAGVIVFRKENGVNKFLLLHYPSAVHRTGKDYWDYVKGHVETGEKELETAAREAEEETGIKYLEFVPGFRESMRYFFRFDGKLIFKIVVFRLAKTNSETVILSGEHNDFVWLPYREAYEMLSFKNAKAILEKANKFLAGAKK